MSQQLTVDVPHSLGAAEAKRRIQANVDRLGGKLPAGAEVRPHWEGERLKLDIAMLGQQAEAALDIMEPPCSKTGRKASGAGGAAAGRRRGSAR